MKAFNPEFSITELCGLFGYTRFAWYRRKNRLDAKVNYDEAILDMVRMIRKEQPKVGTPKLYRMLKPTFEAMGIKIGRHKLNELIQTAGLGVKQRRRRYIRTTNSNHRFRKYPHLVREFEPNAPHQLWVVDITFIPLLRGFCYLMLLTDAYSRKIVGWHLSKTMLTKDCIVALEMALEDLPNNHQLIHHSDRGSQYGADEYTELLTDNEINISMTENSDPKENAMGERVNGILKGELLLGKAHKNFRAACGATQKAIHIYNFKRLHSSIDYLTPAQAHLKTGKLPKHWKNYRKEHAIRRIQERKEAEGEKDEKGE